MRKSYFILLIILSFVTGLILPTLEIWSDFFSRVKWALSGGGGESAVWGEPLFYILVVGLPYGLAAAGVVTAGGLSLRFFANRIRKWKEQAHDD